MARSRKLTPSYVLHKQSGQGRLVWYDGTGLRQQKLLPGPFGSSESLAEKARLEFELATSPLRNPTADRARICVNELLVAFLEHAERHYRGPDGNATSELREYKLVSRHVRVLYGDTPVAEFGPLRLKAVRQKMIDAGMCRGVVNQRIGRVRRMFKWGAGEELVPSAVYQSLAAVAGLQTGRTEARETQPVRPVPDDVVNATLPHLSHHVRAMVELMMHTNDKRYREEGKWGPPRQTDADALEQSAAMMDRYNRIFLRTLRALCDMRRLCRPVIVQNGGQMNLAEKQVNLNLGSPAGA